jgi:tetratricopeptide (TPR) repeat protein
MLTELLPKGETELTVEPQPVQIVVADEVDNPLALIVSPIADLAEIRALRGREVSVREVSISAAEARQDAMRRELQSELRKLDRFPDSPTLLNRLAILAAASGDREQEGYYLELAREASDDEFFAHRMGDNLVARHRGEEAKRIFSGMNLETDAQANLKLAAFHVRQEDFDLAQKCVSKALEIEPLSFQARLFDGGLALAARDYARAIHSLRIALEERSGSSAVHTNMAVAYVGLEMPEKALSALKRAVALDPLNSNALSLFADVAHSAGRSDEAIPALRYFVEFEQTESGVWERLARALLELGKFDECIGALKRQASLEETSAVWNNLGVAYARRGDVQRAQQSFKHAMEREPSKLGREQFLAARNMAQVISGRLTPTQTLAFTRQVLALDKEGMIRTDDTLSDLYAFHIDALRQTENESGMKEVAREILDRKDTAETLRQWIVAFLLGYMALRDHDEGAVLSLIRDRKNWLDNAKPLTPELRAFLFNNAAFALAEFGHTSEAEEYLKRVSSQIHREPYPTATLGLIHFRKGHLDKGVQLYEEAVQLARGMAHKKRIRQKLNLELARYWAPLQASKAQRLLEKVVSESHGEDGLVRQARKELLALPFKGPE